MPDVDLRPARRSQLPALERLFQLYCHDFDDFLDEGVDENGLYEVGFNLRRYFNQAGYWAYFVYVDEQLGGFCLLSDRIDHREGEGRYIDEFFVLRTFRRAGVGRSLAHQVFSLYSGYWEVVAIEPNKPALSFWRTVIGEYTGGDFREFKTVEDDMGLIWFTFDSSA